MIQNDPTGSRGGALALALTMAFLAGCAATPSEEPTVNASTPRVQSPTPSASPDVEVEEDECPDLSEDQFWALSALKDPYEASGKPKWTGPRTVWISASVGRFGGEDNWWIEFTDEEGNQFSAGEFRIKGAVGDERGDKFGGCVTISKDWKVSVA